MKNKLRSAWKKGQIEAGCDEAGRGCLAGPVFAGAVILPDDYFHPFLTDSKQLSLKKREELRDTIIKDALAWSVAQVSPARIDEINILHASIQAMHLAVENLTTRPEFLLIDGHRFTPFEDIPHSCEIKGDGRFLSIAAASILAKTFRDEYMQKIHKEYPVYQWIRNKGYPTREHRIAIAEAGISPYHRKSFRLLNPQLEINFVKK